MPTDPEPGLGFSCALPYGNTPDPTAPPPHIALRDERRRVAERGAAEERDYAERWTEWCRIERPAIRGIVAELMPVRDELAAVDLARLDLADWLTGRLGMAGSVLRRLEVLYTSPRFDAKVCRPAWNTLTRLEYRLTVLRCREQLNGCVNLGVPGQLGEPAAVAAGWLLSALDEDPGLVEYAREDLGHAAGRTAASLLATLLDALVPHWLNQPGPDGSGAGAPLPAPTPHPAAPAQLVRWIGAFTAGSHGDVLAAATPPAADKIGRPTAEEVRGAAAHARRLDRLLQATPVGRQAATGQPGRWPNFFAELQASVLILARRANIAPPDSRVLPDPPVSDDARTRRQAVERALAAAEDYLLRLADRFEAEAESGTGVEGPPADAEGAGGAENGRVRHTQSVPAAGPAEAKGIPFNGTPLHEHPVGGPDARPAPDELTQLQVRILLALADANATGRHAAIATEKLTELADKSGSPKSIGEAATKLVEMELLRSKTGNAGGRWLTERGVARVRELRGAGPVGG